MCLLAAKMLASYDADSVNQRPREVYRPACCRSHFNFPAEMMGPALTAAASVGRLHHPGARLHLQDLDREPAHRRAGGIYLFEDGGAPSPTPPCTSSGCSPWAPARCSTRCSDVNEPLSRLTKGIASPAGSEPRGQADIGLPLGDQLPRTRKARISGLQRNWLSSLTRAP